MRFIIKEQPYEKLLAAGMWRYERDGRPTGAVEHWRLTEAASGFRFLRVDLDARAADSGHTYLYHALLNEDGRIERLKYRFWGNGLRVSGDVVLEVDSVTASREVNGVSESQVLAMPAGYGFWFPSTEGLGLAAQLPGGIPLPAVTLNSDVTGPHALAVQQVELTRYMVITDFVEEDVAGRKVEVSPRRVAWNGHERMVYLCREDGRPVKMVRADRLTAVSTRYINY
ncbi:MAG: hypothetical protein ACE5E7_08020 [Anaerolineae bacterium]